MAEVFKQFRRALHGRKKLTTTVTKLVSYCYGQVITALGLENLPLNGFQESQGFIRTNANN